jgi:hypothetical protein
MPAFIQDDAQSNIYDAVPCDHDQLCLAMNGVSEWSRSEDTHPLCVLE